MNNAADEKNESTMESLHPSPGKKIGRFLMKLFLAAILIGIIFIGFFMGMLQFAYISGGAFGVFFLVCAGVVIAIIVLNYKGETEK